jgi:hypothetical protein
MTSCQHAALPRRGPNDPARAHCFAHPALSVRVAHHHAFQLCSQHAVEWINDAISQGSDLLRLDVLPTDVAVVPRSRPKTTTLQGAGSQPSRPCCEVCGAQTSVLVVSDDRITCVECL